MTFAIRGDAMNLPFGDDSVDLIVTSPPYYLLRSYVDGGAHYEGQIGNEPRPQGFVDSLVAATAEMKRVLKPTGSIFVNLNDKYSGAGGPGGDYNEGGQKAGQPRIDAQAYWSRSSPRTSGIRAKSLMLLPERYRIACVDELNLIARAVIIWQKPNGQGESARDRVCRVHEDWVHLTKEPQYFSDWHQVSEPYAATSLTRGRVQPNRPGRSTIPGEKAGAPSFKPWEADASRGKRPTSVRSVSTERWKAPPHLTQHFASFPQEWPRFFILGWSPDGGVVLDPFGGTGTTAMVAKVLGRTGISIDLSADYCALANWRINESGHGARSVSVTAIHRQRGMAV